MIREASRVLRPGGRFAVSDVIADPDMDDDTRADMAAWTGCIAGALTESEFRSALQDAGFEGIEIRETHRVHKHAGAAIVRARKPDRTITSSCSLDEAEQAEQLEHGCCPFFDIQHEPGARRVVITADDLNHAPDLDAIAHALTQSRPALPVGDDPSSPGQVVTSCCSSTALETCCEPQAKEDCCGDPTVELQSRCGCR